MSALTERRNFGSMHACLRYTSPLGTVLHIQVNLTRSLGRRLRVTPCNQRFDWTGLAGVEATSHGHFGATCLKVWLYQCSYVSFVSCGSRIVYEDLQLPTSGGIPSQSQSQSQSQLQYGTSRISIHHHCSNTSPSRIR